MYTLEMARAHMRELQELADRSRSHTVVMRARRADRAARRRRSR